MTTRRQFLKQASLVSASMFVPGFIRKSRAARNLSNLTHSKTLVVIQLSGGNDGLNTVIPYQNDHYYRLRPNLAISPQEVYEMNGQLGLHPSLEDVIALYDEGSLAVINSVGYPNPNRSHFRSMDIWQSASDSDQYISSGWVGRLLDSQCPHNCAKPYTALEIDDTLSLALKGEQVKGLATTRPQSLHQTLQDPFLQTLAHEQPVQVPDHPHVAYLRKTLVETATSAEYVRAQSQIYKSKIPYPPSAFARKLKTIAELIVANTETRVYYVSLSGFDTHINQKGSHANLLRRYSEAIGAFVEDLDINDRFQDTLIMTFSEFGRRVAQNASRGTDHGTANNLFLMGGNLKKAGIYNAAPNLTDLDEGDLKYQIDFRQVYATVLEDWLEVDAKPILGKGFRTLGVV